jgi:hypothetical protein
VAYPRTLEGTQGVVVISAVQGPPALAPSSTVSRVLNANASGFRGVLSDPGRLQLLPDGTVIGGTPQTESVGWLAVAQHSSGGYVRPGGAVDLGGALLEALYVGAVSDQWSAVAYDSLPSARPAPPLIFGSTMTALGLDFALVEANQSGWTGTQMRLREDTCVDEETTHAAE